MEGPPDSESDRTSGSLPSRVGSALTWRTIQLGADQGLSIVRFVILARLLVPADFGILAIATVMVDLLMSLTNFGLLPALVQLRDRRRSHYDAAWTVSVIRGAAISATLFTGAGLIADLYQEPRAAALLQVMAIRPFLSGFASPRLADLERELDFRALAMLVVFASVVQTATAIALTPVLGVYAIAVGMIGGALTHTVLSYRAAPHRPALRLDRASTAALLRFGRWVLITSLIGNISRAALGAVISRHLGAADLGLYYLAFRLAYAPAEVMGTVVGSVAFPLHARLRDQPERAGRALRINLRSLVATLVPMYVVLIGLVSSLTRDVLGDRWLGAEELISVLAIAAAIGLMADAVFPMLKGRGEPDRISLVLGIRTVLVLAVAWPLTSIIGVLGAAFATVVAEAIVQIFVGAMALRRVPRPFLGVPTTLGASLGAGAVGVATGRSVDALLGSPAGGFVAGVTAGIVALGTLWGLNRALGLRLTEELGQAFPMLGRLLARGPERA